MKPHSHRLRRWRWFGILALGIALLGAASAPAAETVPDDPVQHLARLLESPAMQNFDPRFPQNQPEAVKQILKRVEEAAARLRTPDDLGRALLLRSRIPENVGKELARKWQTALRDALASDDPLVQAAGASQVEFMGKASPEAERGSLAPGFAHKAALEMAPDLLRQLQQKDPLVRLTVARALGELAGDNRVWEALGDRLEHDQDALVSEAAAGALRRTLSLRLDFHAVHRLPPNLDPKEAPLGPVDRLRGTEKLIAASVRGLKHASDQVRRATLQNIRQAAKDLHDAADALLQRYSMEEESDVPFLQRILQQDEPVLQAPLTGNRALVQALPEVKANLEAKSPAVRLAALEALEAIGDFWSRLRLAEKGLAELKERLRAKEPPPKKEPAPFEAARLTLKETVPGLRFNLRQGDVPLRLGALYVLETMEGEAEPALDEVLTALKDESLFVRWGAARVLERLAPKRADRVVPALAAVVKDEDADVRTSALHALRLYGPLAGPAVAAVGEVIKTSDLETRLLAIRVLVAVGKEARPGFPALITALSAPEQSVRSAAAQALGRLGGQDPEVRASLRKALLDADPEVRRHASAALLGDVKP